MNIWDKKIKEWLESDESENLEFKEAKERYDFEELVKYCCAIANECGGYMVLGISDTIPREVVGSRAFADIGRTKTGLLERLHLRIEADETVWKEKRVMIFTIPSRPIGMPKEYKGAYWMRSDEGLAPMTPEHLKSIFDEAGPDYTAEICPEADIGDLSEAAVERLKETWYRKSGNENIKRTSPEQLLADTELVTEKGITYAALILLGTEKALAKHLAQAEIILEYRSEESKVRYDKRYEYRKGFFLYDQEIWDTINLRNDVQHYRDGLFVWDIPTFNEDVVREAVLNAVSHRDYRMAGSVFIKQYPRKLEIVNPGGLPQGITLENMLYRQAPRNRRIAEVFARCGLVERSGQGLDLIFETCIKESKPVPDFRDTDQYHVSMVLECHIQDDRFLRFLEKIGEQTLESFTIDDLLALDHIHRELPIAQRINDRLTGLIKKGVVEKTGRGKGTKYLLSRKFYHFIGEKGTYTRKRGLDWDTNKALLLKHIKDNLSTGSRFNELKQVLPALSRSQVQCLLRELRSENKIIVKGKTKGSKWFPQHEQSL